VPDLGRFAVVARSTAESVARSVFHPCFRAFHQQAAGSAGGAAVRFFEHAAHRPNRHRIRIPAIDVDSCLRHPFRERRLPGRVVGRLRGRRVLRMGGRRWRLTSIVGARTGLHGDDSAGFNREPYCLARGTAIISSVIVAPGKATPATCAFEAAGGRRGL